MCEIGWRRKLSRHVSGFVTRSIPTTADTNLPLSSQHSHFTMPKPRRQGKMAAGATSSATARSKRPRGGAANGGSKQQQSSSETPQASTTTVTATASSSSSTGKRQRRRSVDTRYSAPTQEELSALRNLVPASASDSVQKGQQARLAAAAGSSTASLTMEVSPLSRFLACLLCNSHTHTLHCSLRRCCAC